MGFHNRSIFLRVRPDVDSFWSVAAFLRALGGSVAVAGMTGARSVRKSTEAREHRQQQYQ